MFAFEQQGWISDEMGVLNTAWVAQVRKVTLSEKESKIKKKNLTCATTFPRDKAKVLKPILKIYVYLLQ